MPGPTPGGALRARIVAAGIVNARMFRDRAPEGATMPYLTFIDPISATPALHGDGRTLARQRLMQIDLWQQARTESDALLVTLEALVDGAPLDLDGETCTTRLQSTARIPDPDGLVVHHALTVAVHHGTAAA